MLFPLSCLSVALPSTNFIEERATQKICAASVVVTSKPTVSIAITLFVTISQTNKTEKLRKNYCFTVDEFNDANICKPK